jgi:hypothetical protein
MCVCGLWFTTSNLRPQAVTVRADQLALFNLRHERLLRTTYHLPDIPPLVTKMVPVKHARILGHDRQPAIHTLASGEFRSQQPLPSWLKISVIETRPTIQGRLGGVEVVCAEAPLTRPHCILRKKVFFCGENGCFSVASKIYNGDHYNDGRGGNPPLGGMREDRGV